MAAKKKEKSLEESFSQLEEILEQLTEEPESLETAFQLYKKGIDLVKECNGAIDKVEKEMILLEEGDENEL